MADLLIKNANLVLLDRIATDHCVLCKDGKIAEIGPSGDFQSNSRAEVIDALGLYLGPGFIDLHTHGIGNYLLDRGPNDLAEMCKLFPKYGVTGFLAGVCPLPKCADAEFLSSLSEVCSEAAQIFGFHLEGPFLTLTGALSEEAILGENLGRAKSLIQAAKPYKAVFSIAPDFEGIEELIPVMAKNDTPVFITHTKANVSQTQAAIALGAKHATHFYDVFPCPNETDPGVRP